MFVFAIGNAGLRKKISSINIFNGANFFKP